MKMDEVNRKKILGLLGFAAKARKAVTGADHVAESLRKNDRNEGTEGAGRNPGLVLIASDAAANTVKRLTDNCKYHRIRYEFPGFTMDELSSILGKTGSVSTVAIYDRGFLKALLKLFDAESVPTEKESGENLKSK